jgi:hypothetical protein
VKSVAWRATLVLGALVAAVSPTPPGGVERLYSNGAYLALQTRLTPASNLVPFALIDALVIVVAGGWVAALVRDLARRGRGGWVWVAANVAVRSVVLTSALYLSFLFVWGLNYRRVPLTEKLQFDAAHVSPDAARLLAAEAVDRVNALYDHAHAVAGTAGELDPQLAAAFASVQRDLGSSRPARPGRPKPTLLDFYLRRAAVSGMTDPYFLETLVTDELLPFERPFVIAHEWSHLAGYADEGEANFVGWLTCLRGAEANQYSGWLFMYDELVRTLRPADRAELADRLAPGPRADRRAIADRIRRHVNPRVSAAGWRVYDRYLKANRIEAGAASYATVVRLALGTRFGPEWMPLKR